ncbi:hypothetical protein [Natronoglomus mannanivorans]|uniref:Uncharacterized protein n=1 Tax=Natronoglomus mannanivorans TaxID=2979990 RepID=A0AAP3E496_9EURY|nr:hypothetical protein [Halobacteria archaeon AArc-xg1-1]
MATTTNDTTYTESELEAEKTAGSRSALAMARRGAFYLSLGLAAAMTVLFLPDLLALLVMGWTAEAGAELGIHRLHVMGIAAVVGAFLLGLFVQAYKPRERIASMWGAFLVILTASVGTVWFGVGRPEEVLPFLAVTGIALVVHPAGRRLLRRGNSYSPALLGLVAVAAIPILAFAATQLSMSSSTVDPHALDGHYVMMTALLIAPLAYGLFAALGFDGWRLASWFAALPIAYYGLLSIAFPAQVGSTGAMWGVAAICWAIAFVAVAEYSRMETSSMLRREVGHSS